MRLDLEKEEEISKKPWSEKPDTLKIDFRVERVESFGWDIIPQLMQMAR